MFNKILPTIEGTFLMKIGCGATGKAGQNYTGSLKSRPSSYCARTKYDKAKMFADTVTVI